jgi:hypothetical protein
VRRLVGSDQSGDKSAALQTCIPNTLFHHYFVGWGLDLCEMIRGFDTATPIIFFSALAYPYDCEAAIAAGAQEYLIKPNCERTPGQPRAGRGVYCPGGRGLPL